MAVLLGLLTAQQKRTAISVNAGNKNLAVFGVAIGLRKAELYSLRPRYSSDAGTGIAGQPRRCISLRLRSRRLGSQVRFGSPYSAS
jgi:hypothetical protein